MSGVPDFKGHTSLDNFKTSDDDEGTVLPEAIAGETVYEKIKRIAPQDRKPWFLPVFGTSTPVFNNWALLIMFDYNPPRSNVIPGVDIENTLLFMESGGYLNTGRPETPEECLRKQMKLRPDLVFTLDYPPKIKKSDDPEIRYGWVKGDRKTKQKRIQDTIDSARYAMNMKINDNSGYEWEPVAIIQGYDLHSNMICAEELYSMGYDFFCVGGITTSNVERSKGELVQICSNVRDVIGKKPWLHLLGVTEVRLVLAVKDLITAFDSALATWHSVYANMYMPDGSIIKIGDSVDHRSPGTFRRRLETDHDYVTLDGKSKQQRLEDPNTHQPIDMKDLQRINFENYIKHLESTVWK